MIDSKKLIPISIVTGFLGSGKTTLLNQLLSSPELADTAVLINEFGEIGLDHLLVNSVDEDIILLESGCVCCSVRDDFSSSLLMLHDKRAERVIPPFQRVILETTGIADPIAIFEFILADKEISRRYICKEILTVVDAVYGQTNLDRHLEAVKQVSVADHIIISKTDLCDKTLLENMEERLHKLNPLALRSYSGIKPANPDILSGNCSEVLNLAGKQLLRQNTHSEEAILSSHDHRFATFSLAWSDAVDWDDFVAWLEALLIVRGDSIHRVKGLLNVNGESQPVVIQGVQHSFYPPVKLDRWPESNVETKLVFITSDFSKQAAIKSLENILTVSVC
ncbi:MAG: GTP-binding protein [Gammaproteobacteria bacterium]|nr:GTP-binding protein [Gammaproteobacteria bacterium]